HQRMQVEDIARLRCEKLRLQRARLGLIAGKLHRLELQRDHRLLEFDYDAPDLPQAELLQKGLDRIPDSAPKFQKMLACFDVLINMAKRGKFSLDPEPELNLLYGQEPSLDGAYLRNVFRRFVAAQRQQEEKHSVKSRVSGPRSEAGLGESGFGARDSGLEDSPPTEQERLLLLKKLFAAKQDALRRHQLYNREFVDITPDQRDACYAPSEDADVNLMRQEAQNDRQLRWALKLYWQTQKGDAEQADALIEALEKSLAGEDEGEKGEEGTFTPCPSPAGRGGTAEAVGEGGEPLSPFSPLPVSPASGADTSNHFDENRTHQVVENTGEVSGIGQNNPKFGQGKGEEEKRENGQEPLSPFTPFPISPASDADPGRLVETARPRVKELLEQMQSDPEARALVETFLLSQMVQEESQQEEQELAALQRERQKREALEEGLEQMVVAQQELESKNRRLRARVGESEVVHQQVQQQIKPAGAVVAERQELTDQEIFKRISAVIGVGQPM
ncbi:MAG TPA: hypothetical protein VN203_23815, partial [Candidatus Acidoferrum sp.]|nr:hypothetical protein [Candidatus Acidoferrum sp.]